MLKKIIATLSSLLIIGQSYAASSAVLTINVGGAIWALPYWTVGGVQGSAVTYTFAAFTGASGNTNLTSGTNTLFLKLDSGAPVTSTVTLSTPTGCTIGGANGYAVPSANVKLVTVDGTEQASGSLATTLFTQANQATSLRFKTIPSTASGNVACSTQGSLTYSY